VCVGRDSLFPTEIFTRACNGTRCYCPPVEAGTRFQSSTVRMLHLCLRIGYGEEALKIEKTRVH
jgi:hypothetical protein